jgi:hypothetical protein
MTILQKTGGQEESTSFQRPSRSAHSYSVLQFSFKYILFVDKVFCTSKGISPNFIFHPGDLMEVDPEV